jgi:hypothetical protein
MQNKHFFQRPTVRQIIDLAIVLIFGALVLLLRWQYGND